MAVDLQGFEVLALHGAMELLNAQLVSWIFCEFDPFLLRQAGTQASVLLDLLHVNGFACVNSRAKSWRPWNHYQGHANGSGKHFWTNILCGHKTVAQWVGSKDWRQLLLDGYCQKHLEAWSSSHPVSGNECGGYQTH